MAILWEKKIRPGTIPRTQEAQGILTARSELYCQVSSTTEVLGATATREALGQ